MTGREKRREIQKGRDSETHRVERDAETDREPERETARETRTNTRD